MHERASCAIGKVARTEEMEETEWRTEHNSLWGKLAISSLGWPEASFVPLVRIGIGYRVRLGRYLEIRVCLRRTFGTIVLKGADKECAYLG